MKRTTRFLALGAAILAMAALGQSCMTNRPYFDEKQVTKARFGDPSNSTLIYGAAGVGTLIYTPLTLLFLQVNPAVAPMTITPGYDGKAFFIAPVPVGSELKLVFYEYHSGNTTFSFNEGLQGRTGIDAKATKPGLCFVGSFLYTDNKGTADLGLYDVGTIKEAEILRAILPEFRGTAWEVLIMDRIKELAK